MFSIGFVAALGMLFSLLLTPLLRDWLIGLDILDRPGGPRKLHQKGVPRMGGVAVAGSYALAYGILLAAPPFRGLLTQLSQPLALGLLPAVVIVFLTGLIDDAFDLRPRLKLAGQIGASALAYWGGVRIHSVAGHAVPVWTGLLITVAWLVLCANAFNLIDGVDGLAAGLAVLGSITIVLSSLWKGELVLALAAAPLLGVLLGFLRYNFYPASIFLGDCGSLFIGFLLGCFGILWSQQSQTVFGLAAPLMALAIPLLDVGLSILRRWINDQPVFSSDRGHIHHRLLDRGFTSRGVTLSLYAVCGLGAALALLENAFQSHRLASIPLLLFAVSVCAGVSYLRYAEFKGVRRFLWMGFRTMLRTEVILERFERALGKARSAEQCWKILQTAAGDLGYRQIHVSLAGEHFGVPPPSDPDSGCWQMRLNLAGGDFVTIAQRPDSDSASQDPPAPVGPFIEVLRRVIPGTLDQMHTERPGGRRSAAA
jgi:UDP-GlcNAc:undecaprenyl-phosphate GlcNAc-1-phosphate transferase